MKWQKVGERLTAKLLLVAAMAGLFLLGKSDVVLAERGQLAAPPIPVLDWEPRSDWLSVKEFGALGDGKADDTAAIQNALDRMSNGSTVYLPPGKYRITDTLLLTRDRRLSGVMLVGHGRDTWLVWDGEEGGAIFHPNGVAYARYVGLVFDGQGRAGAGMMTEGRFFTDQVRHQHLAFLNFTDAGFLVHPERKHAVSEPTFENCYFENNRRGIVLATFNDYHFTIDGCEFRNNGVGVDASNWGTFYIRNTHFYGSTEVDIKAMPHHASSVRRTTSMRSHAFLDFTARVGPMMLQDVHIADWTNQDGAIMLAGAPVTIFDCTFINSLHDHGPIKIMNASQRVILSNNTTEGVEGLIRGASNGDWTRRYKHIHEVPAGELGASLDHASQRFIRDTARLSGKVFDARKDFGAQADGQSDDTEAIQRTIDAARRHGRGR